MQMTPHSASRSSSLLRFQCNPNKSLPCPNRSCGLNTWVGSLGCSWTTLAELGILQVCLETHPPSAQHHQERAWRRTCLVCEDGASSGSWGCSPKLVWPQVHFRWRGQQATSDSHRTVTFSWCISYLGLLLQITTEMVASKQQIFILSQFQRPEVQNPGVGRIGSFWDF